MFRRLYLKLCLWLNPPKTGDVFYGDPAWFFLYKPVEYVLHGLKDSYGNKMYNPVPSKGCVRFTIEHCGNLNYILGSEVLCRDKVGNSSVWMKRTQPRRMSLGMFKELVLVEMLWRQK
jgi:hypothetical protein